jgi:hypothetical protein
MLMLQRTEFDALLGPLQQLLDMNAATYKQGSKKPGRVPATSKVSIAKAPSVPMRLHERRVSCSALGAGSAPVLIRNDMHRAHYLDVNDVSHNVIMQESSTVADGDGRHIRHAGPTDG